MTSVEKKRVLQVIFKVSALLLLSTTIAALPLGPYALPSQSNISEQPDIHDDSIITDWPLHLSEEPLQAGHYAPATYSTDLWSGRQDLYHSSTASSTVLLPVVSVPDVTEREVEDPSITAITEPNVSTYLHLGTEEVELPGGATPFVFHAPSSSNSTTPSDSHVLLYPTVTEEHVFLPVSSADSSQFAGKQSIMSDEENVPAIKPALISEIGDGNQNFSGIEETTVSINGVPKYSAAEYNSSVLITSKDLKNITESVFSSSDSILSENVNISLDSMIDNLSSFSHGMNKPLVNIPRLLTRDVKNSSELSVNTSSPVSILTSHEADQVAPDHTSFPSSLLTQLKPLTLRTGKAAGYFPSQHHPLAISTVTPSKDGPDAFPFPHSSDLSDVVQGYKQGPKNSDDLLNSRYIEAIVKDSDVTEDEKSDSRVIWISRTSPVSDITPGNTQMISKVESKPDNIGMRHAEDVEMADGPYSPPEGSTSIGSRSRVAGDGVSKPVPTSSHESVVPVNRTVDGSNDKPSNSDNFSLGPNVTGQGKEKVTVTPQQVDSSKVMNTSAHSVLQSDNRTKIGHIAPIDSENVGGNTSFGSSTDDANSSTVISEAANLSAGTRSGVLALPTSAPGMKQIGYDTAAKNDEDSDTNTTTALPTVVPVSNGRVAAAAADESHHELDAASITGISLGILVFAGLVGAVSFILYRRRFLNKPQTLNDKCSNPDSSGYIDDSTLRENSEEMYSLDNDSFLNSLEAMTIQNYWTDNVKHTKL